ncbi:YbaB/EbfC family nucleoid-associated protein [Actinomadura rudentiformis]|uniref:YbaB/EbfC family nucleoid-associated protein n=2 Tax=Actinomadura rudentiformis TaxID=359158 RepID=A0A6H9YZE9_9ACTN|nr:YbaB/EbfC family nucleoid-associated protein [Actinomadura rudentiformis]
MLTDARKTLESMRKGGSADQPAATPRTADSGTPGRGESMEGVGLAADGRVRATVMAGGRLKSVEMDPRAMRLASAELGEQIVVAVNAALDDLRTKAAAAPADELVDTAALGKQVEEIQNQSLRQMELITQALNDTISKIGNTRR